MQRRTRAWRRWQVEVHLNRRLKRDRNEHGSESVPHYLDECDLDISLHFDDGSIWTKDYSKNGIGTYLVNYKITSGSICFCFYDTRSITRFKEQPQQCSRICCSNQRKYYGLTLAEKRFALNNEADYE